MIFIFIKKLVGEKANFKGGGSQGSHSLYETLDPEGFHIEALCGLVLIFNVFEWNERLEFQLEILMASILQYDHQL